MRRIVPALLLLVLVAGCGGSGRSSAPQPPAPERTSDFVGIYADDVFFGDAGYRREALARQHDAGIELIRQPFGWTDFVRAPQRFDDFVGAAADAGIRVLPVLIGSKGEGGMKPPDDPARFAGWAALLVQRYGPAGSFWNGRAKKLPITSWQIWNEPNIKAWWAPAPDPAAYAGLLRRTGAAIHKVDPKAEIVAAGLPTSHLGMPAPEFLADVLKAGASFDTAAVHPYASTPDGVVNHVEAIKRVVGDKAKVWVTEVGWGTGGNPGPLTVPAARQADYLRQTVTKLRALGVRGVVVFQWRDPKPFPGRRPIWPYYAGLLDVDGKPKPSLAAFTAGAHQIRG
ncbi:MAG TPA: glycosyl hydrolase [Thermoleophilaceae bacterium]